MVTVDGRGGLLGLVLPTGRLADGDADPAGREQVGNPAVFFEVGTGRVTPRIPAAPVLLAKQALHGRSVLIDQTPLGAYPVMPELGQRFGHLRRQAMEKRILAVVMAGEEFSGSFRGPFSHGDYVEGGVVDLVSDGPVEVGDAEVRSRRLPGEGKAAEAYSRSGPAPYGVFLCAGVDYLYRASSRIRELCARSSIWIERLTTDQEVGGSSPSGRARNPW